MPHDPASGWSSPLIPVVMLVVFVAFVAILVAVTRWIIFRVARLYRERADAEVEPGEARRRREIEESGWDPKKRA